jgi:hypothetical protein
MDFVHRPEFAIQEKHNVSETGEVSETLCFLVFTIPGDGRDPVILNIAFVSFHSYKIDR